MEEIEVPGIFRHGRDLYTRNLRPRERVYGEELRTESGVEYRLWDPWRSKLAAFLLNAAAPAGLARARTFLYLGGSHGTTVSHLSDAFPDATIFVVEKSPTSFAPLLALARRRPNLLPLLADAQLPERYAADVGPVDFLYQDVAQRAQAQIFRENARACLRPDGAGLLMLKVRSVSQRLSTRAVLGAARRELVAGGLAPRDAVELHPFSREHLAVPVGG